MLNTFKKKQKKRYGILSLAGWLYRKKEQIFPNFLILLSWYLGVTIVLSTETPGTLTRAIHFCLSNSKQGRIFSHTVLTEAVATPLPSRSENMFFYCILEWVGITENCGSQSSLLFKTYFFSPSLHISPLSPLSFSPSTSAPSWILSTSFCCSAPWALVESRTMIKLSYSRLSTKSVVSPFSSHSSLNWPAPIARSVYGPGWKQPGTTVSSVSFGRSWW